MYEFLGIGASILVLISFMFTNEKKIRQVNMAGSMLFAIYGYIIGSISIVVLNIILLIVHIYKLRKLRKQENQSQQEQQSYDTPTD